MQIFINKVLGESQNILLHENVFLGKMQHFNFVVQAKVWILWHFNFAVKKRQKNKNNLHEIVYF